MVANLLFVPLHIIAFCAYFAPKICTHCTRFMAIITFQIRSPGTTGHAYLRVCIQDYGARRFVPLAIKLQPHEWDKKAQWVKSSHP